MDRKTPPAGFDLESIIPPIVKDGTWPVSSLAIDLSGSCNISCRYCAESATQPSRGHMTEEVLEATWKYMFPNGTKSKGYSIRLGSGEPLLGFHLMKKIAELAGTADDGGKGPEVYITTNGTLIDDEIFEWLVQSGWHIKLSLDGPQHIQDKWRVHPDGSGTYEKVADLLKRFVERIPDRIEVTAVMCHGTDPADAFNAIAQLGVTKIEMVPAVHEDESVRLGPDDLVLYRSFIKDYAQRLLNEKEAESLPQLVRFRTIIQRIMGYNVTRLNCGAGRNFVGVDPAGNLSPCFRFIGVDEYQLGDVFSGKAPQKAKAFMEQAGRTYDHREPCNECWAAPLCAGPCYAVVEMFGPGKGKPIDLHCDYFMADVEQAIPFVDHLRENDTERLLSFLPGQQNFADLF
ncbi:MAG: SPASM domain-containing protein [bacterium]|nr:SPASM domain-containing protein [bacterium]